MPIIPPPTPHQLQCPHEETVWDLVEVKDWDGNTISWTSEERVEHKMRWNAYARWWECDLCGLKTRE